MSFIAMMMRAARDFGAGLRAFDYHAPLCAASRCLPAMIILYHSQTPTARARGARHHAVFRQPVVTFFSRIGHSSDALRVEDSRASLFSWRLLRPFRRRQYRVPMFPFRRHEADYCHGIGDFGEFHSAGLPLGALRFRSLLGWAMRMIAIIIAYGAAATIAAPPARDMLVCTHIGVHGSV